MNDVVVSWPYWATTGHPDSRSTYTRYNFPAVLKKSADTDSKGRAGASSGISGSGVGLSTGALERAWSLPFLHMVVGRPGGFGKSGLVWYLSLGLLVLVNIALYYSHRDIRVSGGGRWW